MIQTPVNNVPDTDTTYANLLAKYGCPLCNEVFINTFLTSCRHKFCRRCILKWLRYTRKCPSCVSMVTKITPVKRIDIEIENVFQSLPQDFQLHRQELKRKRYRAELEWKRTKVAQGILSSIDLDRMKTAKGILRQIKDTSKQSFHPSNNKVGSSSTSEGGRENHQHQDSNTSEFPQHQNRNKRQQSNLPSKVAVPAPPTRPTAAALPHLHKPAAKTTGKPGRIDKLRKSIKTSKKPDPSNTARPKSSKVEFIKLPPLIDKYERKESTQCSVGLGSEDQIHVKPVRSSSHPGSGSNHKGQNLSTGLARSHPQREHSNKSVQEKDMELTNDIKKPIIILHRENTKKNKQEVSEQSNEKSINQFFPTCSKDSKHKEQALSGKMEAKEELNIPIPFIDSSFSGCVSSPAIGISILSNNADLGTRTISNSPEPEIASVVDASIVIAVDGTAEASGPPPEDEKNRTPTLPPKPVAVTTALTPAARPVSPALAAKEAILNSNNKATANNFPNNKPITNKNINTSTNATTTNNTTPNNTTTNNTTTNNTTPNNTTTNNTTNNTTTISNKNKVNSRTKNAKDKVVTDLRPSNFQKKLLAIPKKPNYGKVLSEPDEVEKFLQHIPVEKIWEKDLFSSLRVYETPNKDNEVTNAPTHADSNELEEVPLDSNDVLNITSDHEHQQRKSQSGKRKRTTTTKDKKGKKANPPDISAFLTDGKKIRLQGNQEKLKLITDIMSIAQVMESKILNSVRRKKLTHADDAESVVAADSAGPAGSRMDSSGKGSGVPRIQKSEYPEHRTTSKIPAPGISAKLHKSAKLKTSQKYKNLYNRQGVDLGTEQDISTTNIPADKLYDSDDGTLQKSPVENKGVLNYSHHQTRDRKPSSGSKSKIVDPVVEKRYSKVSAHPREATAPAELTTIVAAMPTIKSKYFRSLKPRPSNPRNQPSQGEKRQIDARNITSHGKNSSSVVNAESNNTKPNSNVSWRTFQKLSEHPHTQQHQPKEQKQDHEQSADENKDHNPTKASASKVKRSSNYKSRRGQSQSQGQDKSQSQRKAQSSARIQTATTDADNLSLYETPVPHTTNKPNVKPSPVGHGTGPAGQSGQPKSGAATKKPPVPRKKAKDPASEDSLKDLVTVNNTKEQKEKEKVKTKKQQQGAGELSSVRRQEPHQQQPQSSRSTFHSHSPLVLHQRKSQLGKNLRDFGSGSGSEQSVVQLQEREPLDGKVVVEKPKSKNDANNKKTTKRGGNGGDDDKDVDVGGEVNSPQIKKLYDRSRKRFKDKQETLRVDEEGRDPDNLGGEVGQKEILQPHLGGIVPTSNLIPATKSRKSITGVNKVKSKNGLKISRDRDKNNISKDKEKDGDPGRPLEHVDGGTNNATRTNSNSNFSTDKSPDSKNTNKPESHRQRQARDAVHLPPAMRPTIAISNVDILHSSSMKLAQIQQ